MRAALGVCLLVLLAGCLDAQVAAPLAGPARPADLTGYLACPVVNGTTWPCEPSGDDPTYVEVEDEVPPAWRCLSFGDQRFADGDGQQFPFPDWYTYAGPALDTDRGAGALELGFRYDSRNDTREVEGMAVVVSEDATLHYVWDGPSAGFVRLPIPITDPAVYVEGVMYPGPGPTKGLHNATGKARDVLPDDPQDTVEGAPGQPSWTTGPFQHPASNWTSPGTTWQWDLVQTAESAGQRLHVAADRAHSIGHDDPRQLQGSEHWGQWRGGPWNATIPGVHASSMTPYMEFSFEAKDIRDAAVAAFVDFACHCPDVPLASKEGVFCLLGTKPPFVEDGVVRAVTVDGAFVAPRSHNL